MPLKYFRIDGVATHLHHRGATTLPESPPDCSRGATVLCLHGTGGNAGDFAPVLDALADEHSPLAFDQPGHGRSGSLDSLGAVDRMRDFTRALAEKLALPPQVLVGHSLGAAVAIDSALETPDAVRGVVVISAGAAFDLSDELMDRARLVTEGKRRRDFDPKAFVKGTQPEVIRGAYMASLKTDPRATYGDLLALRDWDRTADLGRLSVPVLALHGEGERWRGDSADLDWTYGCVALGDEEIDFLAERVEVGTPVDIVP